MAIICGTAIVLMVLYKDGQTALEIAKVSIAALFGVGLGIKLAPSQNGEISRKPWVK